MLAVSTGCGSTISENCTYFENTGNTAAAGGCRTRLCKCAEDICQIRLDFLTFAITGPSTDSASVGKLLNGFESKASGKEIGNAGRCLTDTFSISNQNSVPVICGTNTGFHVYFDVSDSCHDLDFAFGQNAVGVTSVANRMWNIKVSQYSCNYENLAPSGCTQWFFGSGATNIVKSFNFDGSKHLADQTQTICVRYVEKLVKTVRFDKFFFLWVFRRESGNCRVCWSADAKTDFSISRDTNQAKGVIKGEECCAYGVDGEGIDNKGGYDCVMIPGAVKADDNTPVAQSICGNEAGLVTAPDDAGSKTICSRVAPFRLVFNTDTFEMSLAAMDEGTGKNAGFKIRYFQTTC